MPTEPLMIRKTTNDLAILVASQVHAAGLSEEVESHFLAQKQEVVPALKRGFVLPSAIPLSAYPVEMVGYPLEETDCFEWLNHAEQFTKDLYGLTMKLRDKFTLPARLPWKQALPVFHLGLSHREMVDKTLKSQGIAIGEYVKIDALTLAEGTGVPHLGFIERSLTPTPGTMGLPPRFAKHWFSGRQTRPIDLSGYGSAVGLFYRVEKQFLDSATATWFSENTLSMPDGDVAYGYYNSYRGEVDFNAHDAGYEDGGWGFREEVVCFLKT